MAINVVSQEVEGVGTEQTFVGVDEDSVGGHASKHCFQILQVLVKGGAGNQDIINIHLCGWYTEQCLVHESLEGLGGIAESKWHLHELKQTKRSSHCSLGDVHRGHRYLVISTN